jgi:hypothetical protein
MDLSHVTWRKASYSGDNGGECVEVGTAWRKASYKAVQLALVCGWQAGSGKQRSPC